MRRSGVELRACDFRAAPRWTSPNGGRPDMVPLCGKSKVSAHLSVRGSGASSRGSRGPSRAVASKCTRRA
jgi:hypothetical protein